MSLAVVIGAGPAGLMAADALSCAGHRVILADAMPSPGRKLLMAGKSGLNLTKDEDRARFIAAYGAAAPMLRPMLEAFGPDEVRAWAETLGQAVFTGSSGLVFPRAMKASPLMRAWLVRLAAQGVELPRRWRWCGWKNGALAFETPDGGQRLAPDATVLACGGASWRRLGSDGAWAAHFPAGALAPFSPANVGLRVDWSPHMERHFGQPVKGIALTAGIMVSRGEIALSRLGIEGSGIYRLTPALREGAALVVDLLPDRSVGEVRQRLARPRGKASLANHLRKALRLDPVKIALLHEFGAPLPDDLAPLLKALRLRHAGLRDMDEAISTAGGLRFSALDAGLMLRDRPGTFAAGEMLDWEAPTGGYLLTGCLATGRWAGKSAAAYLASSSAAAR